jgi:hypothetical protein
MSERTERHTAAPNNGPAGKGHESMPKVGTALAGEDHQGMPKVGTS